MQVISVNQGAIAEGARTWEVSRTIGPIGVWTISRIGMEATASASESLSGIMPKRSITCCPPLPLISSQRNAQAQIAMIVLLTKGV